LQCRGTNAAQAKLQQLIAGFADWKDADPILKQAKAEYAKLR
jgi:hypothetical protein